MKVENTAHMMDLLLEKRMGCLPGVVSFRHFAGVGHKDFQMFPGAASRLPPRNRNPRDRYHGRPAVGKWVLLVADELPVERRHGAHRNAEDRHDPVIGGEEVAAEEPADICEKSPGPAEEGEREGDEGDEEEEDEPEEDTHLEDVIGDLGEGTSEDEIPQELPDEGDGIGTGRGGVPDEDSRDDGADEELDKGSPRFHQVDDIEAILYKVINDKRAINWGKLQILVGIRGTSAKIL